ncbi:MAG: tetratricopeptide repeat protein [Thiotrichaceae bacterium]
MTDLKTDQEKAEDLKQWWKENGISVLTGVALAIASVLGWQQWQAHKLAKAEETSSLFAQLQQQADPAILAQLKTEASSPYASLAALTAAKKAAQDGNADQAKSELQWTIANASDTLIQQVARLHLIRLQISTKNFDSAKTQLAQSFSPAYSSLVEELKGDLHFAQNELKEAADAYKQAIQLSDGNPPMYLQMKLDNLGGLGSKTVEGA